ncbi:MAG: recombination protein RecR [Bacteroidia bacterium]|nr:recombination protein RecR [Bacteroidia bacterium]
METGVLPSKLLDNAVTQFAKLPGIGRKTALRLVLHLLKQDTEDVAAFGQTIIRLREEICYCKICNNISDREICNICADTTRDNKLLCVVENIRDVMAVETTHQYKGLYHVLGGIISPIDGIGPAELNIPSLEEKAASGKVKEIILALKTTIEGDTTNFYLFKKLNKYPVEITIPARGVAIGDELEFTDSVTLGSSIINRTLFEPVILKNVVDMKQS